MKKKKRTKAEKARVHKMKSLAMWLVIGVLGLSLIGGVVRADEGSFSWSDVETKVAEMLFSSLNGIDEMLGGPGSRFPNGLSADNTSPIAGEVRGTTLTMTGASSLGGSNVVGSINYGGSSVRLVTTTANTIQLTAADVCDNGIGIMPLTNAAATLIIPTSASLIADCIPNPGDEQRIRLQVNSSGLNGWTVTASSTIELQEMEGGTAVVSTSEYAILDFMNIDDTTTTVWTTITQAAD